MENSEAPFGFSKKDRYDQFAMSARGTGLESGGTRDI